MNVTNTFNEILQNDDCIPNVSELLKSDDSNKDHVIIETNINLNDNYNSNCEESETTQSRTKIITLRNTVATITAGALLFIGCNVLNVRDEVIGQVMTDESIKQIMDHDRNALSFAISTEEEQDPNAEPEGTPSHGTKG